MLQTQNNAMTLNLPTVFLQESMIAAVGIIKWIVEWLIHRPYYKQHTLTVNVISNKSCFGFLLFITSLPHVKFCEWKNVNWARWYCYDVMFTDDATSLRPVMGFTIVHVFGNKFKFSIFYFTSFIYTYFW